MKRNRYRVTWYRAPGPGEDLPHVYAFTIALAWEKAARKYPDRDPHYFSIARI
jgi:hypothetical protein